MDETTDTTDGRRHDVVVTPLTRRPIEGCHRLLVETPGSGTLAILLGPDADPLHDLQTGARYHVTDLLLAPPTGGDSGDPGPGSDQDADPDATPVARCPGCHQRLPASALLSGLEGALGRAAAALDDLDVVAVADARTRFSRRSLERRSVGVTDGTDGGPGRWSDAVCGHCGWPARRVDDSVAGDGAGWPGPGVDPDDTDPEHDSGRNCPRRDLPASDDPGRNGPASDDPGSNDPTTNGPDATVPSPGWQPADSGVEAAGRGGEPGVAPGTIGGDGAVAGLRETVLGGHTPRPATVDVDAAFAACRFAAPGGPTSEGDASQFAELVTAGVPEHPATGERTAFLLIVLDTPRCHDLSLAVDTAAEAVHGASTVTGGAETHTARSSRPATGAHVADRTTITARECIPAGPGGRAPAVLVELGDPAAVTGDLLALTVEWTDDAGRPQEERVAIPVTGSAVGPVLERAAAVRWALGALESWASTVAARVREGSDLTGCGLPEEVAETTAPLPLLVPADDARRFAALSRYGRACERAETDTADDGRGSEGARRRLWSLLDVLAWQPPVAEG